MLNFLAQIFWDTLTLVALEKYDVLDKIIHVIQICI